MKTLIVTYIPRGERSHTKKLLDVVMEKIKGTDVEGLDLLKDVPDLFMEDSVSAYIHRNYLREELTPEQAKSLAKMDSMIAKTKAADIIILATPMYNFSLPATVKAYFDSVIFKGETWDADENGYIGLLKGKKALILMASGGIYEGDFAFWDHAMPYAEQLFGFMGIEDVRNVRIQGVNAAPDKLEEVESGAKKKLASILDEWYK